MLLILSFISPFGHRQAFADTAHISVTTDQLVYNPSDKINFKIGVDAPGENLEGDLLVKTFPAASPLDDTAFSKEPLADIIIQPGFNVEGGGSQTTYQATTKTLKIAAGGFPVRFSLVKNGKDLATGDAWVAVVDPTARDPLDLVLIWTAGNAPQRNPLGVFQSRQLLDRCQPASYAPDNLHQHLDLSGKYPRLKTTYAFEGLMLDELEDMSNGFTLSEGGNQRQLQPDSPEAGAALGCLQSFKNLAKADNTEILSTPYTFTELPVLAKEGWSDGNGQYRIGHDLVTGALNLPAVPRGAFIPGLDLTTDSLRYISATGGDYAVLAGFVRQNVTGPAATPDAAALRLRDLGGERITALFARDDASQKLLGNDPDVNAFFAALANAYVSPAKDRLVIAASPVANPPLTADLRDRVYQTVDQQSWINSLTLKEAEAKYHPDTHPATLQRYIDPIKGYVQETYYGKLSEAHRLFEAYRLAADSDEPELLKVVKNMFAAESGYFLSRDVSLDQANAGLAYQQQATQLIQKELEGLKIEMSVPLLQKSAAGEAVISITNERLYAFNVDLNLSADGVEFPSGETQKLRLPPGRTELKIPYNSGGWSRITASLKSADLDLAAATAGVHPVTTKVWIVLLVALAAIAAAISYYFLVVRKT